MKNTFSSADFDKTPPVITPVLPDRLIHKGVLKMEQPSYSAERKHPVYFIDLPTKTLSMTVGGLLPGGCSNKHRHTYETVLFVLRGCGYTVVEDNRVDWEEGDAVYIPVWAWHQHFNTDKENDARYLACENAPLLQNLGGIAIREES